MQTAGRSMRMISYDARLEIAYIAAVLDKRWIPPEATHSKIWATKLNEDYTDTTIYCLYVHSVETCRCSVVVQEHDTNIKDYVRYMIYDIYILGW